MHEWSVGESANELGEGSVTVHWLSDMGEQNLVRTAYIGSDTMVEHQYGTAALFIQVPKESVPLRRIFSHFVHVLYP
jgi:hypothetical protein